MLGTDGCAVVTSLTSGRYCRGVAARATAAVCRTSGVLLSRAHLSLRLLFLFLGRAHGCTATVAGERRVVAEMREKRLLISLRWLTHSYLCSFGMTDSSLPWDQCLCARNGSPIVRRDRLAARSVWRLSEACHSGEASDDMCTAGRFATQSCKRAVSDYGGKFLLHVYPCHADNNPFQ